MNLTSAELATALEASAGAETTEAHDGGYRRFDVDDAGLFVMPQALPDDTTALHAVLSPSSANANTESATLAALTWLVCSRVG